MPTIQAQDIVNAVIQDSQNQTTNRTALYDYTDRVHQRILRESLWRFLLSDPQYFVTLPGVASYALTNGTKPSWAFQTNLNLANFANIAPGTVFNLSTWTKIEEDSDTQTTLNFIINQDGSLRNGLPRTYSNSIQYPGTITLKPVPDGENFYYPVPETPYTTYAPATGCILPNRIYYGVVTFVDAFGGESSPCVVPLTVAVLAGNVVTVNSPNPPLGLIGGNQIVYTGWNLYMGYAVGAYRLQNSAPIALGTSWTEAITGIVTNYFSVPSTLDIPTLTELSILSNGMLQTTYNSLLIPPAPWALIAPDGGWWEVLTNGSGYVTTQSIPVNSAGVTGYNQVLLEDTTNTYVWAITVINDGQLESTVTAAPIPGQLPSAVTIQPLNAYVIQFRYYQTRNQIVNPTDVLQIPYQYKDIVIAGVNYLANMYMDLAANAARSEKTMLWKRDFEAGLAQIRRDLRVSYRKTDFIAPDVATQYVVGNQQGIPTMGW